MNLMLELCVQFLLIFRKAAAGELKNDGLLEVYRHIREVDVTAEGVKGAKNFFEAKVLSHCTTTTAAAVTHVFSVIWLLFSLAVCYAFKQITKYRTLQV